ncbi:MAG: hypothetical protein ACJ75H_11070 [Thermoanaerobaculia bacterium]
MRTEHGGGGRTKTRSPSFPRFSLRVAIERAGKIYVEEQRGEIGIERATSLWGYSAASSGGRLMIGALRSFGLLEGGERVKLTGRALRLVVDPTPSTERSKLLQEAALRPPIHAALWEKYGRNLPSEGELTGYLVADEKFNRNVVGLFLKQYRETLEYAGFLEQTGTKPRAESAPAHFSTARPTSGAPPESDRVATLPLGDGNLVELRVRHKISPHEVEDVERLFALWLKQIQR